MGVIANLDQLSLTTRNAYIQLLAGIAGICAQGAREILIEGHLPPDGRWWSPPAPWVLPLEAMQWSAYLVGAYLATTKPQALNHHGIQEIETWSDDDELIAQRIKTAFLCSTSVAEMGDDAQLLAGATLALFDQPYRYNTVSQLLAAALDRSFEQDPFWGNPLLALVPPQPSLFQPSRVALTL
jgi:hypothetical protein